MNAKLPSKSSKLRSEILDGGMVEVKISRKSQDDIVFGGWGLTSSCKNRGPDRYADAHEKEYAK